MSNNAIGVTVVEDGNKRQGEMSKEEILQCVQDIKTWFRRKSPSQCTGASQSDIERLEKVIGSKLPLPLLYLLKENDGGIYIFDKLLLSAKECLEKTLAFESSKGWKEGMTAFCGDSAAALIIDYRDRIFEWDEVDGVGDEISSSITNYLEDYRNKLLSGSFEYIDDIGVVEKSNGTKK